MSVDYSIDCINARLQAVVETIDGGGGAGFMVLRAGATVLVAIQLATPCGTVSAGVLTFTGTLLDPAIGTGLADNCIFQDSNNTDVITGLTVGIPLSGSDVIISNGLNNTLITTNDTVEVTSATITGS